MKFARLATFAVMSVAALALAIGSASTADAKHHKKKKEAAATITSPFCGLQATAPVCATKGGMKFTYNNACYAKNDGATKAKAGMCAADKKKAMAGKKKSGKKKMKKG